MPPWRALVLLVMVLQCTPAQAAMDAALVQRIKDATVFVSLGSSRSAPSGSGFLVHVSGTRGLVVTNAHVVARGDPGAIEVVFNSGTPAARVLAARILGASEASDVAVLELQAPGLPLPLSLGEAPEVVETEAVTIAGFPFGKGFATNRPTPVITLSQGSVSSKRLDVNEEVSLLQIDGDLNPGNSGGPILTRSGALAGVAVATVRQSNIGFAVPAHTLRRVLAGSMVDLSAERWTGGVRIRAHLLDPLGQVRQARLAVGLTTAPRVHDARAGSGRWAAVLDVPFASGFRRRGDGVFEAEHALPAATGDTDLLVGQIEMQDHDGSRRLLAPFRILPRRLVVALRGPEVHPQAREAAVPAPERSAALPDAPASDRVLHALFVNSGLDALIQKLAAPSSSLFAQAPRGEEEQTVRERLLEVIHGQWTPLRVRQHYLRTFRGGLDQHALHRSSELMALPAMQGMHFTVARLDTVGEVALARHVEAGQRDGARWRRRMEQMRRIDALRRFSDSLVDAVAASSATVATLLNDLRPRSTRMSPAILQREVAAAMVRFDSVTRRRVPQLLAYVYRDASRQDLDDYESLLREPAMIWFAGREHEAFRSLGKARFAAAEGELLALFRSLRRELFGLQQGPDVSGMSLPEAAQAIIDSHGKDAVVALLLEHGGGAITITKGGGYRLAYGRPRKDLVSAASVARDLRRLQLDAEGFSAAMEGFQVDAAFRERRQSAAARRTRLLQALRYRAGRRSNRGRTSSSMAVQACVRECLDVSARCRAGAQNAMQQCRRDAYHPGALQGAQARCNSLFRDRVDNCESLQQQCRANC